MGRSRNRSVPPRRGVSRRDFLRRAGGGAAALGLAPLLPACSGGSSSGGGIGRLSFDHGVASGDPLADRVILWTRVTPSGSGTVRGSYVVATDAALANVVQRDDFVTDAARDYTVKIDRAGLLPATTYYYRFSAGGADSPVGRTRTLPVGAVDRLRIAVLSCASLGHGYFNAYGRVAERSDLDLVVHLGDYIYEYASEAAGGQTYGTARAYEPRHEIVSLADYRQRHAQYKRDADLQALHRQHPMVAIWDDHEFANNAWSGGAENHNDNGENEGDWNARVAVALQAYYEWMPVRPTGPGNPRTNYRSFVLGDLAELIMLEERIGARAEQIAPVVGASGLGVFTQTGAFTDPARQLLGSSEEAFFFDRLRNSGAQWKLVGQGVMFGQLKLVGAPNATNLSQFLNSDQWDGYEPVRNRVFEVLKGDGVQPPVGNVVVLTGDIHTAFANDLTPDPNNPLTTAGGYDPLSGEGSVAVEFVTTSVTSPGFEVLGGAQDTLRASNPHIKYLQAERGYMLLDIRADRVSSEWWYVDTIAAPSPNERFDAAFEVQRNANRLVAGTQSDPKPSPPAPAP